MNLNHVGNRFPPQSFISAVPSYRAVFLAIILFSQCALLSGCSEGGSPATIAEEFIGRCEATIEKRQLRKLNNLISERYLDQQGRSKRDIMGVAAAYIFQNKSIHLFTQLSSAVKTSRGLEVKLLAAVAGSPIRDRGMLPSLNADMYWFDILLLEEKGEWLVAEVDWRQAMLDDFLTE